MAAKIKFVIPFSLVFMKFGIFEGFGGPIGPICTDSVCLPVKGNIGSDFQSFNHNQGKY